METIAQAINKVAGATSPSKTSPSQSSQVALQANNIATNPLSEFSKLPPATAAEVMPYILRLAVNFPAMNTTYQAGGAKITFWTVLAEQVTALGWSKERVRYAVEHILRTCPYKEFRVAEFLQIDKMVHEVTNSEFVSYCRGKDPHKPIVSVSINGWHKMLFLEDADKLGLPWKRRYTDYEAKQMTEEERRQHGLWMI